MAWTGSIPKQKLPHGEVEACYGEGRITTGVEGTPGAQLRSAAT